MASEATTMEKITALCKPRISTSAVPLKAGPKTDVAEVVLRGKRRAAQFYWASLAFLRRD